MNSLEASLEHECVAFCRYLVARSPSAYVVDVYRDAHGRVRSLDESAVGSFDRWLARTATRHPVMTRLADVYTAVFFRRALLREKWVLLLAILETSAATSVCFDLPDPGRRPRLMMRMARQALVFTGFVIFSAAVLWPVRLLFAVRAGMARQGH